MSNNQKQKTIIGRAEKVKFPTLGGLILHARIDTGAKTSSIWALSAEESSSGLKVVFTDGNGNTGATLVFSHYDRVKVSSSMGHTQIRYKIKLPIVIKKRRVLATFTISDRSTQVYPVLIGRATLTGKFIVDTARGSILKQKEEERSRELQKTIEEEHV